MFKKLFSKKIEGEKEVNEELNALDQFIQDEGLDADSFDEVEEVVKPEVIEEVVEEIIENDFDIDAALAEVGVVVEEVKKETIDGEEPPKKESYFAKLKKGLLKTQKEFTNKLDDLFNNYGKIDEDLLEELEEILVMADVGMSTTMDIIEKLRNELKERKISDASKVKPVLKDVIVEMMTSENSDLLVYNNPSIIFVIGVNGAGKTTSIGKMTNLLLSEKKSVLVGAADTFRAAAIDQLKVWTDRNSVDLIAQEEGSDPAAVVYDSIHAARSRKTDVLIIDTAGRLHNKKNLMKELEKIFKVVEREYPNAEKEVLLVLDATTGQNAISQAKLFKEVAPITGIILTKLDGTAKGGVVMAVNHELNIPVKLIGVGEGIDDLQKFNPESFAEALLGN